MENSIDNLLESVNKKYVKIDVTIKNMKSKMVNIFINMKKIIVMKYLIQ